MYEIALDDIIGIIQKKTGMERTQIMLKIQKKVEELSGLISMEGAAHVVANELGIDIIDSKERFLKIKDIIPGLRSVSFVGKVDKKFPVYSFDKGERKGKVASLLISDDTGQMRLVIWNHRVELIEKNSVKEGDVVRIYNVFVKEGKYGIEAHMRDKSKLEINPSDVGMIPKDSADYIRISEIEPDEQIKISGSLIDLFSKVFMFKSCPRCKKKLSSENECSEHGKTEPENSFIVNTIVDDGSGAIRCVFFSENVEKLMRKTKSELLEMIDSGRDPLSLLKSNIVGAEIEISGKSRISNFDNNLEILVSDSKFVEPRSEAIRLLETFEREE